MTTSGRQAATGSTSDRSAGSVLQRTLQVAMWVVAALGAAGGYFVQTPGHTELLKTGVVIAIGCFFPILVARLVVAAVADRAPAGIAAGLRRRHRGLGRRARPCSRPTAP